MATPARHDHDHDHDHRARAGAIAILAAFDEYEGKFLAVTRRARGRFERRDWHGLHRDAVERLELYAQVVTRAEVEVRDRLGPALHDRELWAAMKATYADRIAAWADFGPAETFFNSVTRRVFDTVGVDPKVEFVSSDFEHRPAPGAEVHETYARDRRLAEVIAAILSACSFTVPFEDLERDAQLVAQAIDRARQGAGLAGPVAAIDVIRRDFYRSQGVYLVGRIRGGGRAMPLALAIRNEASGLCVDAALLTFSFTRSYFHVEVDRAYDLIAFLSSIMPRKPLSELYSAVGLNKHGKTELYRDLLRHIDRSADRFEIARGEKGMVMLVFTLPSFDVVFKVIRDTFAYPKTSTRRDVIAKYDLVFKHDRAGRLADVQEFEHLTFDRDRFSDDLLAELATSASQTVTVGERTVHIKHLYTERRMVPLNLYLREVDGPAARAAIVDYGQAVKDLAATNIFPGDMLLKNFGVTRHSRVVFYDYDELCPLTDCHFRDMPVPGPFDDEPGEEPSFYVGPHDIFPEEFLTFMGLTGPLREAFLRAHHDLLTARYWQSMQDRLRTGDVVEVLPYSPSRQLRATESIPYRPSRRLEPR